jgi:hypothetical protein
VLPESFADGYIVQHVVQTLLLFSPPPFIFFPEIRLLTMNTWEFWHIDKGQSRPYPVVPFSGSAAFTALGSVPPPANLKANDWFSGIVPALLHGLNGAGEMDTDATAWYVPTRNGPAFTNTHVDEPGPTYGYGVFESSPQNDAAALAWLNQNSIWEAPHSLHVSWNNNGKVTRVSSTPPYMPSGWLFA